MIHTALDAAGQGRQNDSRNDHVGLERLLFFGDAVAAIAITLLALPLVDAAIDAKSATDFLHDSGFELVAAGISFVSIAGSWRANQQLFRHARGYSALVMNLQFLWLASLVALPIATALIVIGSSPDRLSLGIYIGIITLAPTVTRVQREVLAHGGMLDDRPTTLERIDGWLPIALRVVAIVLTTLVPQLGLWSLLVLVLGTVFGIATRSRRRA